MTTFANATGTKVPDFCNKNSYKSSSGGASGPAVSAKEKYITDILNYSPTINFLELERKGYQVSYFVNKGYNLCKQNNKSLKEDQKKKQLQRTNSNPFKVDIENEEAEKQNSTSSSSHQVSNSQLLDAINGVKFDLASKIDNCNSLYVGQ